MKHVCLPCLPTLQTDNKSEWNWQMFSMYGIKIYTCDFEALVRETDDFKFKKTTDLYI